MLRDLNKLSLVIGVFAATLSIAAPALAAPAVDGEFGPIAGGVGSNNEIAQGPDGNMWVTLQNTNGVARITPDGTITEFPLANTSFGIAAGPDGNLWVSTTIGVIKVPPADPGSAQAFPIVNNGFGIEQGPDGNMWVAGTNELVRFSTADPVGTADSTAIAGLAPKGMGVGSDGLIWIASGDKVYSATAADTPTVTPYDTNVGGTSGVQDVAGGAPGGMVAYANPLSTPASLGRITPGVTPPGGTPQLTELADGGDPFGVTFAPDGAFWITRAAKDELIRLTPDGQRTNLTGFSASGNVGPRKVAVGPNGTLWVTLDQQEKVARVTGVEPPKPPPTDVETKIDKGPKKKLKTKKAKAKAKFKFSSPTAGASFECSLKKPGAKKPKFKDCKSPKTYMLKPGKYTFKVRASAGGVTDASPAKQKFKVVEA